jgi:hypothetical protein
LFTYVFYVLLKIYKILYEKKISLFLKFKFKNYSIYEVDIRCNASTPPVRIMMGLGGGPSGDVGGEDIGGGVSRGGRQLDPGGRSRGASFSSPLGILKLIGLWVKRRLAFFLSVSSYDE